MPDPSSAPAAQRPTPISELYRQIWHHARGVRLRYAAALSMLAGSQILKLALPWLAAQAINVLQTQGRGGLARAGLWIGAIVGVNVGVWLLHGPARVLERGVALQIRRSVADRLYARLVQAPLAWHERHHSGDLQHRVAQASSALAGFTQNQFIYMQTVIYLLGPLIALWWLSALTGAVALAGFVIVGAIVLRFDRALMRLALRENHAERRYAARLLDFVGNIGAVASLRLQRATRSLLDTRLAAVFAPLSRSIVLTEWKWCSVDLLTVLLGWGLVALYAGTAGGAVGAGGVLLVGSLVMVHQYAQQASGVLGSMAANFQGLAHMRSDHAGAEPIENAPQQPPRAAAGRSAGWRRIELSGLTYLHGPRGDAAAPGAARGGVHELNLTLWRGERIALVGASGCGKSTLLRVLAGLYAAQQGRVSIDGAAQEPARRDAAEFATLIPQEAEVFEATLLENLTFGQPVAAPDLHRAVHAAALDDVLQTLPQGLDTALAERGTNLSGGQRQRLALARGLLAASDSSLLLLDEPSSALDALTEQLVHQRIARDYAGATIVSSVHRLAMLEHFDRVVFMDGGRIVDVGSVAELRARQPLFAAMFAALGDGAAARRGAAAQAAGDPAEPGDDAGSVPAGAHGAVSLAA